MLGSNLGKVSAIVENDELPLKIGVSLGIFAVSLFAVSFPSISKRVKYIRIPSVVFFLGKHFGTGVILSTGFVHLLPDAFNALRSRWTGFIILASLLSIFLVEYVTTAYVDQLQSYSSTPSSPTSSPLRSPSQSRSRGRRRSDNQSASEHQTGEHTPLLDTSATAVKGYAAVSENGDASAAQTATVPVVDLRHARPQSHALRASRSYSSASRKSVNPAHREADVIFGGSHHRHESRASHASHSLNLTIGKGGGLGVGKKVAAVMLYDDGSEEDRERGTHANEERHHHHAQSHEHDHHSRSGTHSHRHEHGHGHAHLDMDDWDPEAGSSHGNEEVGEEVKVGRRRQVVGILMLQIGIMLHSLVIGLTLSVSSGSEFTTLVTAIQFHQLFEGLSLGIRIAALPSESKEGAFRRLPGRILKPLLTLTFALTTPTGIWIGLAAFSHTSSQSGSPALREAQGLLSAMSAGMLIYAACVEMLAGDFVMDPTMWRRSVKRQVMALVSLIAGVAAMSAIE